MQSPMNMRNTMSAMYVAKVRTITARMIMLMAKSDYDCNVDEVDDGKAAFVVTGDDDCSSVPSMRKHATELYVR